jgi:putative aldouronate transport system substrate-binding protein
MRKRVFFAILVIALVSPAIFATGASDSGAELEEINCIFDRILLPENGQDEWAAAFEELTGVSLNIVKPEHNQYSEILGVTFATGDLPDLVELQTADYVPYATSGQLVPLDDYIAASSEAAGCRQDIIEAYRLKDGHIYAFPTYDGGGCVTYMREDWLDNLNLPVPTTWDEFHNVLREFTFNDPDGNGLDDTIGMTLPFSVPPDEFDYYNRTIMQEAWFGFQYKDGEWVDGFTEPEMVGALHRFQDLYAEGVIDQEFFSNATSAARTKIYEGQAGVMEYWSGTWGERMDASAKSSNPEAEVIAIPPVGDAFYINRVGPCFAITTAADDPGAIFDAFINTMIDEGAGQTLFTHGVEGLHYAYQDGQYVMLPEPSNPDRPFDKAYADPRLVINGWTPLVASSPRIVRSREIQVGYAQQLRLPEGGDMFTRYVGELNTLKQEIFAQIVTGDVSVQAGLDAYRDAAADLHIDEIIAELNS